MRSWYGDVTDAVTLMTGPRFCGALHGCFFISESSQHVSKPEEGHYTVPHHGNNGEDGSCHTQRILPPVLQVFWNNLYFTTCWQEKLTQQYWLTPWSYRQSTKDVNRQVISRNAAPERLWANSREPIRQPLLKKLSGNSELSHSACLAFTDILHTQYHFKMCFFISQVSS